MKRSNALLDSGRSTNGERDGAGTQSGTLPKIRVLATGGTIAGAQASASDYGYKSGAYDVNALIKAVPNLDKLAVLTGEQIASIGSQDMSDQIWLKLAKRVNEVLKSADADGILITHGTDTLEETGYFLSLVTKSDKPVVMVGSMRPATAISADGPGNIYGGVAVLADPRARGKGTLDLSERQDPLRPQCGEDRHDERADVQQHPSRTGGHGPYQQGRMVRADGQKLGNASEFSVDKLDKLPRVDVIYAHANMSADLIDAAVKNGAQGIVIAGVGDGNMTAQRSMRSPRRRKAGVVVVRSTRLPLGVVLRNNEVNDDKLGMVASGELNPAKSRVLLQLALTTTKDVARIQKMFYEY